MSKQNLLGYTALQLEDLFLQLGEKPYRGKQLYKWLYNSQLDDFQLMTDLTKPLRDRLAVDYEIRGLNMKNRALSTDGTEKFLFELDDGRPIEAVRIPEEDRQTLCISSQSGCALACKFCATGTLGLLRNLTVGEILGQLMYLKSVHGEAAFTNVVFMGMGEPFNNYKNVIEAVRIMTDHRGMAIAGKKITVSTSGITPLIRKYADSGLKAHIAVSLHAPSQEKRVQIMPVAERYPLEGLMDAIRYYTTKTNKRVFFEYILFDGFNDSHEDAIALATLVQGIPCKINILPYNPVPGLNFTSPSPEKVDNFARILYPRTPAVTVRKRRGGDIDAACGQLAARVND